MKEDTKINPAISSFQLNRHEVLGMVGLAAALVVAGGSAVTGLRGSTA